ncbi:Mu transposase C-terminal domain-containing protein [Microcoleus sp. FACHB-1515]|uniref:Mu transposase C-terminal domain-containing protein n=1 Tax=Cyanophyceae TaxID=3028117 RepID=UPI0016849E47|nr:Mu transposase C-terminal domain-containing protein [Microcoleus sp. FACHB-1515]MBD2093431.1 Mu transposase C-terminal domain-containing protein [Microcoleus sp. FACHB-1515]
MSSDRLETELPDCSADTVLLDESNFSTDIHAFVRQLLQDGVDPKKVKFRIVSWVAASPDRSTKSVRKREAVSYLGIGKRTLERWLQIHFSQGTEAIPQEPRPKKGQHKLTRDWKQFIIDTWEAGNEPGQEMTPTEVAGIVEQEAREILGVDKYPSYWTVLRILGPLIEAKKTREGVYSAGQGSEAVVKTSTGKAIKASYSNKFVQIDHTLIDVFSIFEDEEEVLYVQKVTKKDTAPAPGVIRLWLTVIKDVYSKCILSHLLSAKQPDSKAVALVMKRAIRPKFFPADYDLQDVKIPYGPCRNLGTDRGKDLDSDHVKEIGKALEEIGPQVGFTHHLRGKKEDGGDVESVFNGLNKRVLSKLPGYTGSNVTKRVKGAEKRACLIPRVIDKIISWYFYGEYNHECPKGKIRTRYEQWLHGLRGKLPTVIDDRRLDICLMKVVSCTVYRHGTIRFKNQLYRTEILKAYEGRRVTMRYDPDNILRVLVFEQETDEKPGRFLSTANMLNVGQLNQLIKELNLEIRMINLKNLESEVFSFEELDEINQAASASRNAANESTKGSRAKYSGKRRKTVADEKEKAKKGKRKNRQKQVQETLHSIAKDSTRPSESEVAATSISSEDPSHLEAAAPELTAQSSEHSIASTMTEIPQPQLVGNAKSSDSAKVIDMSEQIQKRRLQFFQDKLNSRRRNDS